MTLRRRPFFLFRTLAPLACLLALTLCCLAQTPAPDATLERLREDYAMRYLEPEPHMALAKYFRDRGDRLAAYWVLESARRERFEEGEFNAAFKRYFLGEKPFDNGREAETKLLADLARDPKSQDALHGLADIYASREEYAKAEQYLAKLIALRPDRFEDVVALAEVFSREDKEAKSMTLLSEWARLHPETPDAYRFRFGQLSEKKESDKAAALLSESMQKFPREASFPFELAGLRLNAGRLKEAETLYLRAAELAPDSSYVQAWVGRFFFKAAPDDRRALDHYLSAYLLDPHAYETEFVESRIPKLHNRLAGASFQEQQRRGVPLAKTLEDPDPFVVILAAREMGKLWKPEYFKTLVGLMAHDDGSVRWEATELLKTKADASFDPTLTALLQDKDLRRRGLAAYVAVHRWKQRSFEHIRRMLREDAQLLRFDAVSALVIEGGDEGRKLAFEHAAHEQHPQLQKLLQKLREAGPPR
ncbi:MAG TPA: tetratricopeptide repeat protein [Pyrinomonadaceae bacterium]|nr:tetratricopeptide repeat protein [Pyrinomonadaceae bacterium]